jgi:hypothetical protein
LFKFADLVGRYPRELTANANNKAGERWIWLAFPTNNEIYKSSHFDT